METVDLTIELTKIITYCKDNGLASNPVEVLRCQQKHLTRGRCLDVHDPATCPEGATNFDRTNILQTGLEELKTIENKFLTLEVQFYNEVNITSQENICGCICISKYIISSMVRKY